MYCHCLSELVRKNKCGWDARFLLRWKNEVKFRKEKENVRSLNGAGRLGQDVMLCYMMLQQGSSIQRVLHGVFKSIRNQTTAVSTKKTTPHGHTFLLLLPYGLYRRVVKLMNVLCCYYFLPAFLNISCFYVPDRKIKEETKQNRKKKNYKF